MLSFDRVCQIDFLKYKAKYLCPLPILIRVISFCFYHLDTRNAVDRLAI